MNFKQMVKTNSIHDTTSKTGTPRSQQQHFVTLWQKSNLSRNEFCTQYHLKVKTFSTWVRKVKNNNTSLPKVIPPNEISSLLNLQFTLPNGIKLSFTDGLNHSQLLTMIKSLSSCNFN